jgi:hypothetical protein
LAVSASVAPLVPPKVKPDAFRFRAEDDSATMDAAFQILSSPAPPSMPMACETPPDVTDPDEVPKAAEKLLSVVRLEAAWTVMLPRLRIASAPSPPEIPVARVVAASVAPDAPVPPKLKEELDWVIPEVAVTRRAPLFSIRSSPAPPEMPVDSVTAPDTEPAPEEPKTTVAPARLVRLAVAIAETLPRFRMKSDPSPPEIPVEREIATSAPPVSPVPPKLKDELSRKMDATAFAEIVARFVMESFPGPLPMPKASATAPDVTAPLEAPKMIAESAATALADVARTLRSPSL